MEKEPPKRIRATCKSNFMLAVCAVLMAILSCDQRPTSPEDEFLIQFIKTNRLDTMNLDFTDLINPSVFESLDNALRRDSVTECCNIRSVKFTEDEKTFIKDNFRVWTDAGHLLKNSRLLPADTANAFMHDSKKYVKYFFRPEPQRIYAFTKPIFLRKGSFCVFYYHYLCGDTCGYSNLAVYEKLNGKWKVIVRMYSWIS